MLPRFSVPENGFPFANSWEPGTPVLSVPTPFGTLGIGDTSGGVCGGMVFAAIDFFLDERPVPQEATPELVQYFCRRLLDSWALPFGVVKYYDWQRTPGHSRFWLGTRVQSGLTRLTILEEWPRIRAEIDRGIPAPLGLVNVYSWSFSQMARNHQVLCYGYCERDDRLEWHVYDPNWPGQTVILSLNISSPDDEWLIEHSLEGPHIRGLFLTEYRRPQIAYGA